MTFIIMFVVLSVNLYRGSRVQILGYGDSACKYCQCDDHLHYYHLLLIFFGAISDFRRVFVIGT